MVASPKFPGAFPFDAPGVEVVPNLNPNSSASPIAISVWRVLQLLFCLALMSVSVAVSAQSMGLQRDRARDMLRVIKSDIEKNYYDPTFHGVDLDTVFKEADELLKKADSGGQIYGIIARALLQLNDSHTYFVAPSRTARIDYGWTMEAIGDKCYISSVKPGSDADKKGVKPGDLVVSIDEMDPTRENLWMIRYLYFLRPTPVTHFVLQDSRGQSRQLEVQAKVNPGRKVTDLTDYDQYMQLVLEEEKDQRVRRHRYIEMDDVLIWKMPAFDLPAEKVDDMMAKIRKHKALILDLRGNGGGAEETLLRMIGNLFDHDVTVGDLTRRKEKKPLVAKTRGDSAFKGQVIVLTDNGSGSSSELLARVVQLEKRGVVIGDRSAGAVMRARYASRTAGVDTVIFYGVSITDADLIMKDGHSLEKLGVTPDEVVLPTPADMNSFRDPVLARAAEIVGLKLPPEVAGALFPIEWRQ